LFEIDDIANKVKERLKHLAEQSNRNILDVGAEAGAQAK